MYFASLFHLWILPSLQHCVRAIKIQARDEHLNEIIIKLHLNYFLLYFLLPLIKHDRKEKERRSLRRVYAIHRIRTIKINLIEAEIIAVICE